MEINQLLTYKEDVNLSRKLQEWERFYNYHHRMALSEDNHRMKF